MSEKKMPDWKDRALLVTGGEKSQTGAILMAMMERQGDTLPQFASAASVTSDGFLISCYTDPRGEHHHGAFVGSMDDLMDNLRRLANTLDMGVEERTELQELVRKWVKKDYRAHQDYDLGGTVASTGARVH